MYKKLAVMMMVLLPVLLGKLYAGELDGTEWKLKEKGIRGVLLFWRTDVLQFANNQFTSAECVPYGFKTTSYNSSKEGDKVTWNSLATNDKGEKMDWKGTKSGELMEGMFTWTKANGQSKVYAWKASKKSK